MIQSVKLITMQFLMICCILSVGVQADAQKEYSFGVVPQQSAAKLARSWQPILTILSEKAGVNIRFKTAKNIPTFEENLRQGLYDFSYMNPYHFIVFNKVEGYQALVRRGGSEIKGILVVKRDSTISSLHDLASKAVAFPSPAAFAASILPRAALYDQGISIDADYVSSHDSVYLNVARGRMVAGGGIIRTLNALPPQTREKLRVLWTSPGYTPHAVAAHPRVTASIAEVVATVLSTLHLQEQNRALLAPLRIKRFDSAKNSDWDDVRSLSISELEQ